MIAIKADLQKEKLKNTQIKQIPPTPDKPSVFS
jgi:hypothetical protein